MALLLNGTTDRKALYALPMGRTSNHLHAWKSLLKQAGFSVADIPKDWEAFWSFWCDEVQPSIRRVLGREDVWGIGLPMSKNNYDTWFQFFQFMDAYDANYVSPDGRLVIDDLDKRRKLHEVVESYTAIYRKGCTPTRCGDVDRNRQ